MSIRDIEKVGVVGSGLMGHGIALAFAMGGYPTMMCDVSDEVLHTAMENAAATARLFVGEGLITAEAAEDAIGRLSTTTVTAAGGTAPLGTAVRTGEGRPPRRR